MRTAAGWKKGLAFTGMCCLGWWAADAFGSANREVCDTIVA